MVKHPRDYKWSSYCANADGVKNKILIPHDQYLSLDQEENERRKSYRGLFKAHIDQSVDEEIREATNGNYVLGNTRFQEQITQALGRRVIRGKAGRPKTNRDVK